MFLLTVARCGLPILCLSAGLLPNVCDGTESVGTCGGQWGECSRDYYCPCLEQDHQKYCRASGTSLQSAIITIDFNFNWCFREWSFKFYLRKLNSLVGRDKRQSRDITLFKTVVD